MPGVEDVKALEAEALAALEAASTLEEVEAVRVRFLGRKGALTSILRSLSQLPPEERKEVGARANELRARLDTLIDEKTASLKARAAGAEEIDLTLPGFVWPAGRPHPVMQTIAEIVDIFIGLGYTVAEGPEAELDYYNFTALNQPSYHPARSTHDTFYLTEETLFDLDVSEEEARSRSRSIALMRTHTSPVQIRVMEQQKPPIYIVAPGRCYRRDVPDATHSPIFHQIEGLAVDEGITFADLKGTLELFARRYFGPDTLVNFRASYFPFTEPSAEMDVSCVICKGEGCRLCKGSGWLEVLGAGMVHPAVLEGVGIDSERYTGFAFGMGPERLTILKYGIPDIRMFFENDLRFLRQF